MHGGLYPSLDVALSNLSPPPLCSSHEFVDGGANKQPSSLGLNLLFRSLCYCFIYASLFMTWVQVLWLCYVCEAYFAKEPNKIGYCDSNLFCMYCPNLCATFSILLWKQTLFRLFSLLHIESLSYSISDCALYLTTLNLSLHLLVFQIILSLAELNLCEAWFVLSLSLSSNLCAKFSALIQTLVTANGSKFGTISSTFFHSLQHPFLLPSSLLCVGFRFMITNWLLHLSPFLFKNP